MKLSRVTFEKPVREPKRLGGAVLQEYVAGTTYNLTLETKPIPHVLIALAVPRIGELSQRRVPIGNVVAFDEWYEATEQPIATPSAGTAPIARPEPVEPEPMPARAKRCFACGSSAPGARYGTPGKPHCETCAQAKGVAMELVA